MREIANVNHMDDPVDSHIKIKAPIGKGFLRDGLGVGGDGEGGSGVGGVGGGGSGGDGTKGFLPYTTPALSCGWQDWLLIQHMLVSPFKSPYCQISQCSTSAHLVQHLRGVLANIATHVGVDMSHELVNQRTGPTRESNPHLVTTFLQRQVPLMR
jgi:hypothetical protein